MVQQPLRILYGVQATGQGHITRARKLGPALQTAGAQVDFLFSGRPREELYGIEPFGDFQTRRGLTFHFNHGQVSPLQTVAHNNCFELLNDIRKMDLAAYDIVITDYEPITAWAAKLRGKPSFGIGHQYAFNYDIPRTGFNRASLAAMRWFAPADQAFGIHWHHFGHPLLPPMFEYPAADSAVDPRKIVVYLNFEDLSDVTALLEQQQGHDFYIYSSQVKSESEQGSLKYRPLSSKFKSDIETCNGIICGAGFELPTEVMHMGKKILVKAMNGQPEQASNALAIKNLGIGEVMNKLDPDVVAAWLEKPQAKRIVYPDTAKAFAEWIVQKDRGSPDKMVRDLWNNVKGLEHLKLA